LTGLYMAIIGEEKGNVNTGDDMQGCRSRNVLTRTDFMMKKHRIFSATS
jgi:hypothetical protein